MPMEMSFKLSFCFLLLSQPFLVLSLDTVLNDDVLGLIVFKAGLVDPQGKLGSWNEDDLSACKWVGVKCDDDTDRVSEIVLDDFALSGHIDKGLLRLQFLRILSLSNNNFTGTINPDLSHLGGLKAIDLSHNALSGPIPEGFFRQCGSLTEVSFANNKLTGQIPESLSECFSLAKLNFSSNKLSGKLPVGLWNLRGLELVDFSDNSLEGEIHEGIENLYGLNTISLRKNLLSGTIPKGIGGCLVLKLVDFSENSLSGELPDSMRRLSSCSSMSLGGNSLAGEVPGWIGELRSLEALDLSANRFSGRIPASLGNLRALERLNLSRNEIRGSLPEAMSNCTNLLALDVSHNLLRGNLPPWIFRPSVRSVSLSDRRESWDVPALEPSRGGIRVLSLSGNRFSGKIPSDIGALGSLRFLNVSENDLSGSIPASIGELKAAYVLDLSDNRLSGSVPSEIGGASSLADLRLQRNFLSGKIPPEIAKCSALTSLILSWNNLSGPIPAAIANLTNLQLVDFSLNELSGSLPKELTNLSLLVSFNVSHNRLEGELPVGGFFNTISPSSVSGNPALCGSVVNRSCPNVHPKPIVLNPNSSDSAKGSSSQNNGHKKIILSISALVAIGAAAFIVIGVVAVTVLNIHARASMSRAAAPLAFSGGDDPSCSPMTDPNYGKLVMFSGDADFAAGTQALLNKDCELGRGGFGVVYRTALRDGRSVAIKKLTVSSLIKSQDEFEREVKKLGKIRHVNLVSLEGYYWTPSLQLLIYEYVPSGSLYKHLHDGPSTPALTWQQRFGVILGMAKGLSHLHRMNMIHYNLKSTNVLIDANGGACFVPKLGDVGLARLLPMLDRCILSSKIQSALGYMAPEFACQTVKITEKCDVYGFGVLLLEVVTGRRPVEYMEDDVVVLCDMVRGALEDGRVEECVDERLEGIFPAEEAIPVIKLGLICASQVPSNRPDMSEVVNILELIQCPSEGQEELE